MSGNLVKFVRPVNKINVEQRIDNGFINGTAMCVAHGKDVSDWLKTDETWDLVSALADDLGIKFNPAKNPDSVKTRVSTTFPELVLVKRGSPSNGGGTWLHPDLALQLAQWCNKPFAIQVSRWIREWLTTGIAPISIDPEEEYRLWQQRYDIRVELRDVLRPELMNAVIAYSHRHNKGAKKLCIAVHDEMNRCIQGSSASGIRELGGLPLGDLLRDYFEASPLVCYSAINKLATNSIIDDDVEPVKAVQQACKAYLGQSYIPKPVRLIENVHSVGHRLKAVRKQRRLAAGIQLNLLDEAS
jgi:KilA-N domain